MLIISNAQMEALAQAPAKRFENNMIEYVQEYFPKHYGILGEADLRQVIRYGIDQADSYGFISGRDVCLYICLMLMLGSDFDKDLQLPWANEILSDENIADLTTRIDRLYGEAMAYLDRVAGPQNEHLEHALFKIRKATVQDLLGSSTGDYESHMFARLSDIYPEKRKAVGEDNIRKLIRHGVASAEGYDISSEHGQGIFVLLMFMLGSAFDRDPQFSWATKVLDDDEITDAGVRFDRLHGEAIVYLDKWLT